MGTLRSMKIRKEWFGFGLCLLLLFVLTAILLWHSRAQFHSQIIESQHKLLDSEISSIAEKTELKLLESDITFFDLGLIEMTSDRSELLEKIIIDSLTIPKVLQIFAYEMNGSSIPLITGERSSIGLNAVQTKIKTEKTFFRHNRGECISLFLKVDTLEKPCVFEVQLEEHFILSDWDAIDREFLSQGILILVSGTIIMFIIFRFMSIRIREREKRLEQKNQLLQKTNQKLAQVYKTVSLGALTGHLMHSLKTPLTHLQILAQEAAKKSAVDPDELLEVHNRMMGLVSQSLHSLKEIEDQKKVYQVSLREIFEIVIEKTKGISSFGNVQFQEDNSLDQTFDNLNSALLSPILITLIENAFESKKDSIVTLGSTKKPEEFQIHISDTSGGIPSTEREFLFDPSKSRKSGGTGLGLALAHQLAQCMSGSLELAESNQTGSKFIITLQPKEEGK